MNYSTHLRDLAILTWTLSTLIHQHGTVAFSIRPFISCHHRPSSSSSWDTTSSSSNERLSFHVPCPTPFPSPHCCTTTSSLVVLSMVRRSKWDDLVDDDDDDDDDGPKLPPPRPDMRYEDYNLKRLSEQFLALRTAGGKDVCYDIYVREGPQKTEVFWYVGKVACISDISVQQAIQRIWPIIETHATTLRPIELYPNRGKLEIWSAPGDSELQVAYNRPDLIMVQHERPTTYDKNGKDDVPLHFVGFQGEVYQPGEEGFRTWRTNDGLPARPEINAGGETRPPTEEELLQLQKELDDEDTTSSSEETSESKEEEREKDEQGSSNGIIDV